MVEMVELEDEGGEVGGGVGVRVVEVDDSEGVKGLRVVMREGKRMDVEGWGVEVGVEVGEGSEVVLKGGVGEGVVGVFDVRVEEDVSGVGWGGE